MSPLAMYPDGDPFPTTPEAIITREDLRLEELEHPERFGPEYGGQFSAVLNAYLDSQLVGRIFEPWRGQALVMRPTGRNDVEYYAHADPSRSGANFALVIAHAESDEGPDPHIVVDLIRVWEPRQFDDHRINYVTIENELFEYIKDFRLRQLTFDQWNSASAIDHLTKRVRDAAFWWHTDIGERTATAQLNWSEGENFKTALIKNLVHSPYHALAEQELLSVQWDGHQKIHPPPTGPCTTSDIADCIFALTHVILEGRFDPMRDLSELRPRAAYPGGIPPSAAEPVFDQFSALNRGVNWHAARRQGSTRTASTRRYGPHRRPERGHGFS